jgi:selenocysteine lyase/cysteine desulfurase
MLCSKCYYPLDNTCSSDSLSNFSSSCSYKSFFDTQAADIELVVVNITMPASRASILNEVSTFLTAHGDSIYLASFSHIASLPAIILPVKELVALCASHGILTLIDGAHALGQIPVNVTDINANFWLGNGHKWMYSPKGSAILWARKDSQSYLVPTTISEWPGSFQDQFIYVGTTSYAPFLAMQAALDFRVSIGGEDAIFSYIHNLAIKAGHILSTAWATDVLLDDSMYAAMVDVRVPTRNYSLAASM